MLYCDLILNGVTAWVGVPCLNSVRINSQPYIGFIGDLLFIDLTGLDDPTWDGLADRYCLLYFPADGSSTVQIPLQALPSQQVALVLGSQNCVFSFYYQPDYAADLVLSGGSSGWVDPGWVDPGWVS